MNQKIKKMNIVDDKTASALLKLRREILGLMNEHEDKELEQAYESYIKFLYKWLKRNGYIDNDEE